MPQHTKRAEHPSTLVLEHPRPLVVDRIGADCPSVAVVVLVADDSLQARLQRQQNAYQRAALGRRVETSTLFCWVKYL